MSVRLRRHYRWSQPRSALSEIARVDRDRTCERIELGCRVHDALTLPVPPRP